MFMGSREDGLLRSVNGGYDWQQVLAGTGENNLVLKFNVTGFPTKIILDPDGKILYRFLGDTEESFEVLDELLSEANPI